MNWLLIPVLALAFFLFLAGIALWRRAGTGKAKAALLIVAGILAIPAILYDLFYLHIFVNAVWFYELRAVPYSELFASSAGLAAGVVSGIAGGTRLLSKPFVATLLLIVLAIPFLKPLISLVPGEKFQDRWQDGICLQSTSFSCGPASAASILAGTGVKIGEAEIARRCFSYRCGTECWYLARFLRAQGYTVEFIAGLPESAPLPIPSIAGVVIDNGRGHFIPLLAETEDAYVTGDPMTGRRRHSKAELRQDYQFTGFFMKIARPRAAD